MTGGFRIRRASGLSTPRVWVLVGMLTAAPGAGAAFGQATDLAAVPEIGLPPGQHAVGYRVTRTTDPARSFGPRLDEQGRPHPGLMARPVQVHLWYPADRRAQTPMSYAAYTWEGVDVGLTMPPTGDVRAAAEAEFTAAPLRRKASPERLARLLRSPVRAVRDAAPAPGRFPLVLYAPSINSNPYENALLFEHLASHGYVVASAPCFGLDERETSRDVPGAMAEFGDVLLVLSRVAHEPFVDGNRVGAIGFSWGGTTALLLALQHAGIDAVATFDAGVGFADYRKVATSFPWWNPQALRAAHLEVLPAGEPREPAFSGRARYADTALWTIPGVRHADFAADSILRFRWASSDPAFGSTWAFYRELTRRVTLFLDAFLKQQPQSISEFRTAPTGIEGASWAYRPALPPPPTAAEFDRLIEEQGVDAAVARFRQVRAANPEAIVFSETRLLRFGVEFGPERADDLLKLLTMNLEVYPNSAESHWWMAQVLLAKEDRPRAITELEKVLEIDAGHTRAQRLLASLRKRESSLDQR